MAGLKPPAVDPMHRTQASMALPPHLTICSTLHGAQMHRPTIQDRSAQDAVSLVSMTASALMASLLSPGPAARPSSAPPALGLSAPRHFARVTARSRRPD